MKTHLFNDSIDFCKLEIDKGIGSAIRLMDGGHLQDGGHCYNGADDIPGRG